MADSAGHLSDEELAEVDEAGRDGSRGRNHVQGCEGCLRRRRELQLLRESLALAGRRERRPLRDTVPSAMMRLRLRRHGVTNANELLEGFAALIRGLASLFSLPAPYQGSQTGLRDVEDEQHE